MASILFVEDHLGLIEELVQLLLRRRPLEDLALRFATDIASAMKRLNEQPFDLVVLDVMLPSFPGVPTHEEGVYLASWLLGCVDGLPSSLKNCNRPPWMTSKGCSLVLLTSRTAGPVHETLKNLAGGKPPPDVPVIERLRENANDQATRILGFLDRAPVKKV